MKPFFFETMTMTHPCPPPSIRTQASVAAPSDARGVEIELLKPHKYVAINVVTNTNDLGLNMAYEFDYDNIDVLTVYEEIRKQQEKELNDKYFEEWLEKKHAPLYVEQQIIKEHVQSKKRKQRKIKKQSAFLKYCAQRWIKIKKNVKNKVGTIDEADVASSRIGSNPNAYLKYAQKLCKKLNIQIKKQLPKEKKQTLPVYYEYHYMINLNKDSPFKVQQTGDKRPPPPLPPNKLENGFAGNLFNTMKDKFTNFSADCFKNLDNLSLDTVIRVLEKLKPMVFTTLAMNYVTAINQAEKTAVLMAAFEAYDCYWNFEEEFWKQIFITVLLYVLDGIIMHCHESMRDVFGPIKIQQSKIVEGGILDSISKIFKLDLIKYSIDESAMHVLGAVAALIALVTGGSFAGLSEFKFDKILKRINKFGSSVKSITNIVEYVPKLWDTCMTTLGDVLGFTWESKDIEVKTFINDVMELKLRVHNLYNLLTYEPSKVMSNKQELNEISAQYMNLDAMYVRLMKLDKNMSSSRLVFDELKEKIKALDEFSQMVGSSSVCKQEPFLLLLAGKAGIGKSRLIDSLVKKIAEKIEREPTSYPRTTTVKHWDNYSHQSFVVYDDFGQKKTDLDHEDVLEIKNPNKTILTMAKLNEKGRQFTSVGMICATNTPDPTTSATVKCMDALRRRLEINVEVIDPNFEKFLDKHDVPPGAYEGRTGKIPMSIDDDKVPYYDMENFDHLIFVLKPSFLAKKNAPEEIISFDEVVNIVVRYHNVYLKAFQRSLGQTNKITGLSVDRKQLTKVAFLDNSRVAYKSVPDKIIEEEVKLIVPDDGASTSDDTSTSSKATSRTSNFDLNEYRNSQKSQNVQDTIVKEVYDVADSSLRKNIMEVQEYLNLIESLENSNVEDCSKKLRCLTDRENWVKNYQRKKGCSMNKALAAYYDHITKQETKDDIAALTAVQSEFPIVMLLGDSGAGKSTMQTCVYSLLARDDCHFIHGADLPKYVPKPGILVIEDVTISPSSMAAFDRLCRVVYDGKSPVTGILASGNTKQWNSHFSELEDDRYIVERRINFFDFEFLLKQKAGTFFGTDIKYNSEEMKAAVKERPGLYDKFVQIVNRETGKRECYQALILKLKLLLESVQHVQVSIIDKVLWCDYSDYVADISIEVAGPLNLIFERYYENPKLLFADGLSGLVKIKKGTLESAQKLYSLFKLDEAGKYFAEDLDTFVKIINNAGIHIEGSPTYIELVASDGILVMIPQSNSSRYIIYRVNLECLADCENVPDEEEQFYDAEEPLNPFDLLPDTEDTHLNPFDVLFDEKKPEDPKPGTSSEDDDFPLPAGFSEIRDPGAHTFDYEDWILLKHPKIPGDKPGYERITAKSARKLLDFVSYDPTSVHRKPKLGVMGQLLSNIVIKDIFTLHPNMENLTVVLMFLFKLFVAGCSINSLIQAGFSKLKFLEPLIKRHTPSKKKKKMQREDPPQSQAKHSGKKWSNGMRHIKGNVNLSCNAKIYDEMNKILDSTINKRKSAKKYTLDEAINIYYALNPEEDPEDFEIDDIRNFYNKVHYTNYDRLRDCIPQTREEKVVTAKPAITRLTDPIELQKSLFKPAVSIKKEKDFEFTDVLDEDGAIQQSHADPEFLSAADLAMKHQVPFLHDDFQTCWAFMIGARIGVTVEHAYTETATMRIEQRLTPTRTRHNIKVLQRLPEHDIMIFEVVDTRCPLFSNIMSHLPQRNQKFLQSLENAPGYICIPQGTIMKYVAFPVILNGQRIVNTIKSSSLGIEYFMPATYTVGFATKNPVNTQKGDCGSILMSNSPQVKGRFLGLHNSASNNSGHCSFLFQDYFEMYFRTDHKLESLTMEKPKRQVNPFHQIDVIDTTREALLGMPIVGRGDLNLYRPEKSQLWTSPLRLPESKTYEPSIISPIDFRNKSGEDPFYRSIAKWNHPQPKIDESLMKQVVNDIGHWYAMEIYMRNITTKVLTKTEAINSGKNYNVQPLNKQSSAGYPWCKYGKKENFFKIKNSGDDIYFAIDENKECGKKLTKSIDWLVHTCTDPNASLAIPFCGWLKDEPLKVKKIYECNTRSFAAAPIDYTIAYRMYYATIYGAIHEVRDTMPIQVGINPTSMEWHTMCMRMRAISDRGFDLDFAGFDATVPAIMQKYIVEIYNKIAKVTNASWTERDDEIRRGLHSALFKPLILCPLDGEMLILQAPGGQPSGHPGTADDNSMIHLCYLYYCWLKIFRDLNLTNLMNITSFKNNVAAIIYGDDGAYTVSPALLDKFNFLTVSKILIDLGIKCTPASKSGEVVAIIKFTEFEFLKREFKKIGKFWHGPLKETSFEKMLNYCLGSSHNWFNHQDIENSSRPNDLIATADSCMHEAIYHGPEFFYKMQNHLISCFKRISINWYPPTYNEVVTISSSLLPLE